MSSLKGLCENGGLAAAIHTAREFLVWRICRGGIGQWGVVEEAYVP